MIHAVLPKRVAACEAALRVCQHGIKENAQGTRFRERIGVEEVDEVGRRTVGQPEPDGDVVAGTKAAVTMETSVSDLSILTAASSQQAIQALDDAMQQIDSQRSQLGAVQNRFASTVANLQSISQNSSAAKGRVEDADFASEAAELTKQQTLQQASTAILSQANQLPSAVLKLLQ